MYQQQWTVQRAKDLSNAIFLGVAANVFLLAPDLNPLMLGSKLRKVFLATIASCVVGDLLFTQVYPPDEPEKPFPSFTKSPHGTSHVVVGALINLAISVVIVNNLFFTSLGKS